MPGDDSQRSGFQDTVPEPRAAEATARAGTDRRPSEAERISASMRTQARAGRWWAALFLMIVLPAAAMAILYALQLGIARGTMRAATVRSRSGGSTAGLISLEHDPVAFLFQAACLGFVAALCLWVGYRAFRIVFGLPARRKTKG